jgi:hypothetical protein
VNFCYVQVFEVDTADTWVRECVGAWVRQKDVSAAEIRQGMRREKKRCVRGSIVMFLLFSGLEAFGESKRDVPTYACCLDDQADSVQSSTPR